jgi:hypothetical protein
MRAQEAILRVWRGPKNGAMFHLQSHPKWLKRRWFGGESAGYGFGV